MSNNTNSDRKETERCESRFEYNDQVLRCAMPFEDHAPYRHHADVDRPDGGRSSIFWSDEEATNPPGGTDG